MIKNPQLFCAKVLDTLRVSGLTYSLNETPFSCNIVLMKNHQMIAYQTVVATHKVVKSGKPAYLAAKMTIRQNNVDTRHGAGAVLQPAYRSNLAREGFIYRGAKIYNKLNSTLRNQPKLEKFKSGAREWVKKNISIKPKPSFSSIIVGSRRNQPPPPPPEPPPLQNTIRRYFLPLQNWSPNHPNNQAQQ